MVLFVISVTWILAAEMAAVGFAVGRSTSQTTTAKRNVQCIRPRSNIRVYYSPRLLHPWQIMNGPTALRPCQLRSFKVQTTTINQVLPCPVGWEISKRNAQLLNFSSLILKVTRLAWTLHIMKCWQHCMAQGLPQLNCCYGQYWRPVCNNEQHIWITISRGISTS